MFRAGADAVVGDPGVVGCYYEGDGGVHCPWEIEAIDLGVDV